MLLATKAQKKNDDTLKDIEIAFDAKPTVAEVAFKEFSNL